jgi:alpha-glucuronidase
LLPQKHTAIAGVSNVGLDINWCGHHLIQSNWYAFGRLAWDNNLSSEQIADEWVKLTFYQYPENEKGGTSFENGWRVKFLSPLKQIMLESHEAAVNYMMPLGFHHIFAGDHHYGPGPWYAPPRVRKDWTPPYYHKADSLGVGFNRTASGSNALSQYMEPLRSQLSNPKTCPDIYLLWFHHLPWDFKMKSGKTLWDEICYHYDEGVQQVRGFQKTWDKTSLYVDSERFGAVQKKLREQSMNAQFWKDACLQYFQQFSRMPIPYDIERPVNSLDDILRNETRRR